MKTNKLIIGLSLAALIGSGALALSAIAQNSKKVPEPKGKITPWEAIKSAKGKVPGRALNANFEFAEGHWVYAVMIVNGKTIKEVEIDPMTGKVGDTETITPEGEAQEMKDELTVAIGGTPDKVEKPATGTTGEKKE